MRVLVVGGFGNLGSRIAESFLDDGYDVVLGSSRKQKTPDSLPMALVERVVWNDKSSLRQMCKNIDMVVHAAGICAKDCQSDPGGRDVFRRE